MIILIIFQVEELLVGEVLETSSHLQPPPAQVEAWKKEQEQTEEVRDKQPGRKTVAGRVRPGETTSSALRSLGRRAGVAKKKLAPMGGLVNYCLSIIPKKNMMCDVENGVKVVVFEPKGNKYWAIW